MEVPNNKSEIKYMKVLENTFSILEKINHVRDGDIRKEEARMLLEFNGVSLDAKQRKDGRWQARIKEGDTYKTIYGRNEYERNQKVQKYLNDKLSGKIEPPKKKERTDVYTLHNWLDNWIAVYKTKLKIGSLNCLKNDVNHIKEVLPDKPLKQFKGIDIQNALLKLNSEFVRYMALMRLTEAMEKAVNLDIINKNPCKGVIAEKPKMNKRKALTRKEQELLLQNIKGHKLEVIFVLLLTTGLRIGEALALTKDDIRNGYVSVTKNVMIVKGKRIVQPTPKSQSAIRKVILPKQTYELLKPLLNGDNYEIFKDLGPSNVSNTLTRICEKIGIKGVSAHVLRHTYSTRINEAGLPPKIRQYLMGHSDISMTENVYTDAQEDYIFGQQEAINTLFDTEKSGN